MGNGQRRLRRPMGVNIDERLRRILFRRSLEEAVGDIVKPVRKFLGDPLYDFRSPLFMGRVRDIHGSKISLILPRFPEKANACQYQADNSQKNNRCTTQSSQDQVTVV